MKRNYLTVTVLYFTFLASLFSAEVTLKTGKKVTGKLVSEDATQITIAETQGAETKILKTEVTSVDYAEAADIAKAKGIHKHDGFFLRMLGGYGQMNFEESPVLTNGTGTMKMKGPAGFFGFHIGGAIFENFILLASLNGYAGTQLTPELNGVAATTTVDLGVSSYGLGFSYYIMPINLYLSADVGGAEDEITVSGVKFQSEAGLGVNVQIGKEWWVSDNWGLGVALFGHYSKMKDKSTTSIKPDIINMVFGIAFSATYN